MPTRNVVLTDHNEQLITSLVNSGRYQNASEVLREGLRLVERHEVEEALKLQALRDAATIGIEAMERGDYTEFSDGDTLKAHVKALGRRGRA